MASTLSPAKHPEIEEEDFYLMANLFPRHTGLPFVVWISVKGGAKHDVRVNVSSGPKVHTTELISVAIRPNVRVIEGQVGEEKMSGEDLAMLTNWIELNRDVLIRYWDMEIDTMDALAGIKAI